MVRKSTDIFPSILVLGQDFSTLEDYLKMSNENANDLDCPTWRNIIRLFDQSGVDRNQCFFSNVFMGLRKTGSMTGVFPGLLPNLLELQRVFLISTMKIKKKLWRTGWER